MSAYNSIDMNILSTFSVKASSHIITLLGDELIGTNSLALFELVKNSYDAEANVVTIRFNNLLSKDSSIVIEDDGVGMSTQILKDAWLVIGTDYKRKEVKQSSHKKRTSLGNKGVGRLAVHRLANNILLETQPINSKEGSRLIINWNELINSNDYIDGLSVKVESCIPNLIASGHGTRIVLSELREHKWTKSKVSDMVAKLLSIKNPFIQNDDFIIRLESNEEKVQEWIEQVKTPVEFLKNSLYQFKFKICTSSYDGEDNAAFSWQYTFNAPNLPGFNSERERLVKNECDTLPIDMKNLSFLDACPDQLLLKNKNLYGINSIEGEFYAFNLDSKILNSSFGVGSIGRVKDFIFMNSGIKIFRDNIRIFNYGELSDDWLGIDQQKMRRIGSHFAKNQIVGAISLRLADTKDSLVEKTNREGFIENDTFFSLRAITQCIFAFFEQQAISDREVINAYSKGLVLQKRIGFSESIAQLEEKLKKRNLINEFETALNRVKQDYHSMRDVMLNSGMSGLNLALVFHEVEREMGFINSDLARKDFNLDNIKIRIKGLMDLIEKFSPLLRNRKIVQLKVSSIVQAAVSIHSSRFSYHDILFSDLIASQDAADFNIMGEGSLIMSAISNLLDNSIYWVCRKKEEVKGGYQPAIRITTDMNSFDGPAIVVVDNGTGFKMAPEEMILPFRTLKPTGMGVGLYYVSLVMEMIGGKLLFVDSKDMDLPHVYDGACVVLVFPNKK